MTLTQLSYTFLATALREVSEQGGAAFGSGGENMNEIREDSERTKDSVGGLQQQWLTKTCSADLITDLENLGLPENNGH